MLDTGGHMAVVKGIAFTPDGSQLVTASEDKQVRVWDWRSGRTLRIIRGNVGPATEGQIYGMALSPNGRWLATGGWMKSPGDPGHMARLYDFSTGRLVKLLKGHTTIVNTMAFSPDSRRLISGASDNAAIIWDVDNQRLQHRLAGHTDIIHAVAFTPDGARAVTGSNDTTLRLWNVNDGSMLAEMTRPQGQDLECDRRPPVRRHDRLGRPRGRNPALGRPHRALHQDAGAPPQFRRHVSFTQDGTRVVAGTGYQATGRQLRRARMGGGERQGAGQLQAAQRRGGRLDGEPGRTAGRHGGRRQVSDPGVGPATGDTKRTLVGTGSIGWSVGFSPDGRRLAWGGTFNA